MQSVGLVAPRTAAWAQGKSELNRTRKSRGMGGAVGVEETGLH